MVGLQPGPVGPVLAHVLNTHHQASIEVQHGLHGGKHAIARDQVQMSQHVDSFRLHGCIVNFGQYQPSEAIGKLLPVHHIILHAIGLDDAVDTVVRPDYLLPNLLLTGTEPGIATL